RSKVRDSSRLASLPDFVRYGLFIIKFEGFNAGRWNTHEHLFLLPDFKPERLDEAPHVQVSAGAIPFKHWFKYLEQGDATVDGSTGWGTIRNPRFEYAS
ncbi:hypothetical protein, partial [Marivivens donghaensis]|uniref:hypothetical protein n=1 Tax=Marivivens donghaensis TaxID=1699413 RepID=UPI0025B35395